MDYYSALLRSGKILESYFEQSKDILHNGSKGTIRENIVTKLIRPFYLLVMGYQEENRLITEVNLASN